jgi:hypothetical protein
VIFGKYRNFLGLDIAAKGQNQHICHTDLPVIEEESHSSVINIPKYGEIKHSTDNLNHARVFPGNIWLLKVLPGIENPLPRKIW